MRKHLAFGVIIIRKIVFVFCIFVGIYGIVHKAKKKIFCRLFDVQNKFWFKLGNL